MVLVSTVAASGFYPEEGQKNMEKTGKISEECGQLG